MSRTMKLLLVISIFLAAFSTVVLGGMHHHLNDDKIIVDLIERKVTEQELWDMSDVVVKGTILNKIDEINYESDTANSVIGLYRFDVTEGLKIPENCNEFIIAYAGTELPDSVVIDQEYVVFLVDNSLQYEGKNVFSFASLTQGVFKYENGWINNSGEELTKY